MLFYFSEGFFAPLYGLIISLIIIAILAFPIFIFYLVFRNPSNKGTDYKIFKEHSKWLCLICAAISLVIIVVAKSKWFFESELAINRLLFISMIVASLGFIIGIASLPRWQGFLASAVFCFVWFYIFFLPLLGTPLK